MYIYRTTLIDIKNVDFYRSLKPTILIAVKKNGVNFVLRFSSLISQKPVYTFPLSYFLKYIKMCGSQIGLGPKVSFPLLQKCEISLGQTK
jgi:hypothetical protein